MRKCALCIVLCVFVLLTSCQEGNTQVNINMSPENENLVDLATVIYDSEELKNILSFTGSVEELNKDYPIYCIRKISFGYRVTYLGDESIAVLLFNDLGNRLLGNIYGIDLLKSDFDGLVKGQSLNEVRAIDPNGEYLFLYTGRNDTPKTSSHYTKDGYLITIEYDVSNVIISIDKELI